MDYDQHDRKFAEYWFGRGKVAAGKAMEAYFPPKGWLEIAAKIDGIRWTESNGNTTLIRRT